MASWACSKGAEKEKQGGHVARVPAGWREDMEIRYIRGDQRWPETFLKQRPFREGYDMSVRVILHEGNNLSLL